MNSAKHSTVLLAEDNSDDIFLMRRAFERAAIPNPLRVVEDGVEALDYLQGIGPYADRAAHPFPCLLLLDVKMPKINGFDVLRRIRDNPATRRLPVVILTSSNQQKDIDHAYDLGVNSYLVKPHSAESLENLLQTLQTYWFSLNNWPQCPPEQP
jgi:CheY-like chemotaxis protein